ncbi:MAG: hypothetical protein ACKO5E_01765 [bacterium]
MQFGSGRRADGVNDPEPNVLNLSWQGRLIDYCFHKNDEHCEALINEIYIYLFDRLETFFPPQSYWRGRTSSDLIAAMLILVDRGIVERKRLESGEIFIRCNDNAETMILKSVELLPLSRPLLEITFALRSHASRLAHESA